MRAGEVGRALLGLVVLAGLLLPWLSVAPNRLLPGVAASGFAAISWAAPAALVALVLAVPQRLPAWLGAPAALAGVTLLLAATGWAAALSLEGLAPAARAGLGGGFWLGLVAGAALVVARAAALPGMGRAVLAAFALLTLLLLWQAGTFEALSLVVEYRAREAVVHAALLRHLALAGAALALALLLAVPLAWAGFRRPGAAGPVGAALGAVQVVPAIALFAALIPLLAGLLALLPALRSL
ncbi:MAG: ABC transporter permease, partial [Falsiroseomonas sp.]|nr:ABC transporter permease [Falsiroseomonas sp.]